MQMRLIASTTTLLLYCSVVENVLRVSEGLAAGFATKELVSLLDELIIESLSNLDQIFVGRWHLAVTVV